MLCKEPDALHVSASGPLHIGYLFILPKAIKILFGSTIIDMLLEVCNSSLQRFNLFGNYSINDICIHRHYG